MRRVDYNQEKCNYPATTTTNMALSKTYAGSSGAASCFDNNTSTGASFYSYRSWQYAQVDLRGNWNVNRCVVNVVYSYYFTGFYVTASIDGSTWRTIYDQSGQTTTYRGLLGSSASGTAVVSTTHNFTYPGCYRYLRFYFYDYGAGVTGMVREIYVYGPTSSAAIPGTATNQITSASSATTWRYNNDPTGTPNASNNATNSYTNVSIPVAFPNGYNAFYVMKHELTQAAWADFLNSLSVTQQTQLSFIAPTSAEKTNLFTNYNSNLANHRMMIAMREPAEKTPAVYGCTADGENWDHEDNGGNVPMFGLAWSDVTAYLAWACLRPMTELEYEKACRGDQVRVANEYAWGNAVATPSTGIEKANKSDETPTPATGFYAFAGGTVSAHAAAVKSRWPVRAGSFAGEGTDRQDAGASYWGILNLTDNVPERVVSVGHATGRAFTGEHGYGYLTADGFAEINGWPVVNSKVVSYQFAAGNTHANGTDYRGINVTGTNTINGIQTMATRPYNNFINWRDQWTGLRGVRTAQ